MKELDKWMPRSYHEDKRCPNVLKVKRGRIYSVNCRDKQRRYILSMFHRLGLVAPDMPQHCAFLMDKQGEFINGSSVLAKSLPQDVTPYAACQRGFSCYFNI